MPRSTEIVTVPFGYPASSIFVDESGSKATADQFFVAAAVKVRGTGALAREIKDIRDRHGFTKELKFSGITRASSTVYFDIIDALEASDAHLAACVVQGDVFNPFTDDRPPWRVHAEVISQLLVGCINRRELAVALIDGISTPRGCSLEDEVRERVNRRLKSTALVQAVCLDSRTNDLLQVADMVASAVMNRRQALAGRGGTPGSYKERVAKRLALAFDNPSFGDGRNDRLSILTYRGRARGRPRARLSVVTKPRSTG